MEQRTQLRQLFLDVWRKQQQPHTLSALEQTILSVMQAHLEYIPAFNDLETLHQNYRTDNNPFLHLSLHLGLIEQLETDRPQGICALYQKACHAFQDEHQVQHLFMEIMAETIYEAQQKGTLPNEIAYLEKLKLQLS